MADLNYRLQATDAKVATCVHLLSSMEGNLARDSAVNMSKAAPGVIKMQGRARPLDQSAGNRRSLNAAVRIKE
jgi:hypothetical protein